MMPQSLGAPLRGGFGPSSTDGESAPIRTASPRTPREALRSLDPQRHERQRLKEALQLNESLAITYYLKEDLAQVRQQPGNVSARIVLDHWIADAESSGIRQLLKFARTLHIHREGLLNWSDHPSRPAPSKGPTTKSNSSNDKPTAIETSRSSNSNSSRYITLSTH